MATVGIRPVVGRAFYGSFSRLRPAQVDAIDAINTGDDVIVLAGTGSGKTEAVVAPIVSRYFEEIVQADLPIVLYVAPTRALVNDVFRRLEGAFDRLDVNLGVRHGERNDMARVSKPAVLVTTPESLDVMLFKDEGLLSEVRALVVDEAHLLYNTQRGMQLAILARRLESAAGRVLQVAAMSATVGSTEALWSFFRPGHLPRIVNDQRSRPIRRRIKLDWSSEKLGQTLREIRDSRPGGLKVLVFTDSRADCDALAADLRDASGFGDAVFAHHSSLSKEERTRTEVKFLELGAAVCVATSTLELGIDIGDINLVVLWGRALGWQSFLQRVGRGNRRTDEVEVICVVPQSLAKVVPAFLGFQALLLQLESSDVETSEPLTVYGAACQQILSMVLSGGAGFRRRQEFLELFEPWPHLDADATDLMLRELEALEILHRHPAKTSWFGPTEKAHELVDRMEIWSNFPLAGRSVDVFNGGHLVGRIPGQNLLRLELGTTFTLGGRKYQVNGLRADRIDVRPSDGPEQVRLRYDGVSAQLDPGLVEAEWRLLVSGVLDGDVGSPQAIKTLTAALGSLVGFEPDRVPAWNERSGWVHLTCAGQQLNSLITSWAGGDPKSATELTLTAPEPLDLSSLPGRLAEFGELLADAVARQVGDRTVFQNLLPVELIKAEHFDAFLKTAVYQRTLERLAESTVLQIAPPTGIEWEPAKWSAARSAP